MREYLKINLVLVVFSLVLFSCVSENEGKFVLRGSVSDSLAKSSGVKILLIDSQKEDTLDVSDGKFEYIAEASNYENVFVFLATPENPSPDYSSSLLPDNLLPVVKENGTVEVYLGKDLEVRKGDLSKRLYDFVKLLNYSEQEIVELFKSETDTTLAQKKSRQIYEQRLHKVKEIYKENTDNVIGISALSLLLTDLSSDEFKQYWDMASPQLKNHESMRPMVELMLSEDGLTLSEDGEIVENSDPKMPEGQMFKDFAVKTMEGKPARLSDYVGKGDYVLVDFWAYWCSPCLQEMPNLARVNKEFAGKNFKLISISIDNDRENTKAAIAEHNMKWTQLMIEDIGVVDQDYGISMIPYLILFGPDGTVLKKNLRGRALSKEINSVLN